MTPPRTQHRGSRPVTDLPSLEPATPPWALVPVPPPVVCTMQPYMEANGMCVEGGVVLTGDERMVVARRSILHCRVEVRGEAPQTLS